MITVMLVIFLGDFPFLTYGKLGTFDSLKECREHISKDVPEEYRKRMSCIPILKPDAKEL